MTYIFRHDGLRNGQSRSPPTGQILIQPKIRPPDRLPRPGPPPHHAGHTHESQIHAQGRHLHLDQSAVRGRIDDEMGKGCQCQTGKRKSGAIGHQGW